MRIHRGLVALLLAVPAWATAGNCGHHGMGHGRMIDASSAPTLDADSVSEPRSSGARLVGAYCTQCHVQPSPALHEAQEWSQVVPRMLGHMRDFGRRDGSIQAPSRQEVAEILDYLQQNAGG